MAGFVNITFPLAITRAVLYHQHLLKRFAKQSDGNAFGLVKQVIPHLFYFRKLSAFKPKRRKYFYDQFFSKCIGAQVALRHPVDNRCIVVIDTPECKLAAEGESIYEHTVNIVTAVSRIFFNGFKFYCGFNDCHPKPVEAT
jgi:hypothetical protein